MIKFLNEVLLQFRKAFNREATFRWFVIIVIGIMVRGDHLGVTSVVRDLWLPASSYVPMMGYFRSSAWNLDKLQIIWWNLVKEYASLLKVDGKYVFAGDGVKQSKEGKRIPGVKRLHQESENSAKSDYIWGHLFGGIGAVTGAGSKSFCIPLALMLHDGIKKINSWEGGDRQESHVVEMVKLGLRVAEKFGKSILLLDRYFLSAPALAMLAEGQRSGGSVELIIKAKKNCKAYTDPESRIPGQRGRPCKRGRPVKLIDLFSVEATRFVETELTLYGKNERVRYHSVDYLWGSKLYRKLRFVLVVYNGIQSIIASTDLTLTPEQIITLYARRFTIECMFRELKQVVSAFGYRFWSKSMPKLNRFRKKSDPDPLDDVNDEKSRARIILAVKALEGYVFSCSVALGLLQLLSLTYSGSKELRQQRYMRTVNNTICSEATIADYLRKNLFWLLSKNAGLGITKIIDRKKVPRFFKSEAS